MIFRSQRSFARRLCLYAFPLAICLIFLFPVPGEAHPILLVSDPAKDAILSRAPSQVRMQFSEILIPAFTTAAVVNAANQRVDRNDAHVSSTNSREMDISLKPNLPSDVYVVVWQVQSGGDGHVLRSSFLFKVAAADSSVPSLNGTHPGQNVLGGDNTSLGLYTGQVDGLTLFSFAMVTLVNLSVVFWVGAQLWHCFVLQLLDADSSERQALDQSAQQGFQLFFSIPILLEAFIANLGVLIGQGLILTGGNLLQVFPLFGQLMSNGRFGTFWTMRQIVLVLAFVLAVYTFRSRKRSPILDETISWTNLVLGLALLTAVTISGHAAATSDTILTYSVMANWLHLLAASLWIGGMIYLSVVYLPVLKKKSLVGRTRALLTTLSSFSPLAIAGVVIMALTGPFNASVRMSSLDQVVTTAYGRTLIVKVACVLALLLISAIHVRFFRPRLNKTFDAYQVALAKAAPGAEGSKNAEEIEGTHTPDDPKGTEKTAYSTSQEVQYLEENVARQAKRLTRVLHWEPVLGIAVLICTGLMNVFGGTLQPITASQSQVSPTQQPNLGGKAFKTVTHTTDNQFTLLLTVTPGSPGTNVFTIEVLDGYNKQVINVGVSLSLSADTSATSEVVNLQPDGKGTFTAQANLSTSGYWTVNLQVRTPDNILHEASTTVSL